MHIFDARDLGVDDGTKNYLIRKYKLEEGDKGYYKQPPTIIIKKLADTSIKIREGENIHIFGPCHVIMQSW